MERRLLLLLPTTSDTKFCGIREIYFERSIKLWVEKDFEKAENDVGVNAGE